MITGVGAVTPLGVGARDAPRALERRPLGHRGRARALRRVRGQGAPLGQGGAPLRPLHPARAHRRGRGARRRRLGRGHAGRPGPLRMRHRHRHRRHHHDRGAALDHAGARARQGLAARHPDPDGQRGQRRDGDEVRPARAVVRHRVGLRRRGARDRDRGAADRLRGRRQRRHGRHRVHAHSAYDRRLQRRWRRSRRRASRDRSTAAGTASCSARARACWCSRRTRARASGGRGSSAGWRATRPPPTPTTSPRRSPAGGGAARAVRLALEDAGLDAADVAYVNAHGTSTPLNDRAETEAIKAALGDSARAPCRSAPRSPRSGTCSVPPARWRP